MRSLTIVFEFTGNPDPAIFLENAESQALKIIEPGGYFRKRLVAEVTYSDEILRFKAMLKLHREMTVYMSGDNIKFIKFRISTWHHGIDHEITVQGDGLGCIISS